jgi:hypothetical protein
VTTAYDLIREGVRQAYRARPRAPLAGAVAGQAGGSGDGWAVEAKTAPSASVAFQPLGSARITVVPVGQRGTWSARPTLPDATDPLLVTVLRR